MVELPESNLTKQFKKQATQLEDNLFTINKLVELCCDRSLSEGDLLKQAIPIVEKLAKSHPNVGKDLQQILTCGDYSKIKDFFDQDIQRRANL